jgi:hypothetical protein
MGLKIRVMNRQVFFRQSKFLMMMWRSHSARSHGAGAQPWCRCVGSADCDVRTALQLVDEALTRLDSYVDAHDYTYLRIQLAQVRSRAIALQKQK